MYTIKVQLLRAFDKTRRRIDDSAAVRARPTALTGVAAMAGAFFILDDPIFSGLAVSLIFGLFVSTAFTLLLIPMIYWMVYHRRHAAG